MAPQDQNYKGCSWDSALEPSPCSKPSPSQQQPQVRLGGSCQEFWKPQPVSSCFPEEWAACHSFWLPPIPVTRSPRGQAPRYLPGWPAAMPIDGGQTGIQILRPSGRSTIQIHHTACNVL